MKIFGKILLLCWLAAPALAQQATEPTVTTTGEAIVYAAPDEVLLQFTVTTHHERIATARELNLAIVKPAIEYLQQAGLQPQHIQTQYMGLEPVRENYKSNKIMHYRASQAVAICITDLSQYENIVDNLLALGVTSLGSPRFRTMELRRHQDEARRQAMEAAREKAQLLAGALGQKIGPARSISEYNANWAGRSQGAYANVSGQNAPASGDAEMGFAPGQLEIRAIVEVAFELVP